MAFTSIERSHICSVDPFCRESGVAVQSRWLACRRIKALLSRFSGTLKQIEFIALPLSARDSNCTPSECMKVFVEAVRNVGFELHVTATFLLCLDSGSMPCDPRAVWPAGEDFTWRCNMQASHGPLTMYCVGCGWEPPYAPPRLRKWNGRSQRDLGAGIRVCVHNQL